MSSHSEASGSHRARHREDRSDERGDRSREHRRGSASDRSHRRPRDDGGDDRGEGRSHRREGRERRHRDDDERSKHYSESHGSSDRHRRQRRRRSASSSSDSSSSSSSSSRSPSPPVKEEIAVHPRLEAKRVQPLTPSDYYSHSAPFRHWLFHDYAVRHPRSARLDDLSSKDSHRLFDEKFVPTWNRGKLDDEYYEGKITSANLRLGSRSKSGGDASKKKARGWAFLATRTAKEEEQISMMRDSVDSMTNGTSRGAQEMRDIDAKKRRRIQQDREEEREAAAPKAGSGSNRGAQDTGWGSRSRDDAGGTSTTTGAATVGPSVPAPIGPSHPSDHRYDVESSAEKARLQAQAQRRASRRDEKDRQEELAPRATGRDAVMEKRREKNRSNREFAEGAGAGGGAGMDEMDENDLMGGGDSFADALAAKRAAAERRNVGGGRGGGGGAGNNEAMSAREAKRAEREAEQMEKRSEYRRKEDATMDMFKKMAAERFG